MSARDRLYGAHEAICKSAYELMLKKNADYANGDDPYRNFRMFGGLGILVRLSDKIARLRSYEERGRFSVEDEGLIDTVRDLVNYAVIYFQYKTEEASCASPENSNSTETRGKSTGVPLQETTTTLPAGCGTESASSPIELLSLIL